MIVAPSLLSCDFGQLNRQLAEIEQAGAEYLHFDVMDGHFVNNLTFGPDVLKGIRTICGCFMDVHLMVENPTHYADVFIRAGAQNVTFHVEAITEPEGLKLVEQIHERGVQAGVTLRPITPVEVLLPYLDTVDLVLVMSVNPGFGGQSFMEDQLDKVRFLKQYRSTHPAAHYVIEIDGGINETTARLAKQAGCDIVVAGSYVFHHPVSIQTAVESLR